MIDPTGNIPPWAARPVELLVKAYTDANSPGEKHVGYHLAGVGSVVGYWRELQECLDDLPRIIRGVDTLVTLTDIYAIFNRNQKSQWSTPASTARAVSSWGALSLFLEVRGQLEELEQRKNKKHH